LAKERIGILGGAFDPIHQGHIQLALSVVDAIRLDQMLIMPGGNPAYKSCLTLPEDRWKMTVAACAQDGRLIPSRLEMDHKGAVYTIDTLLALKKAHPRAELYYVMGADALMKLRNWRRAEEVYPLCIFLVCSRSDLVDSKSLKEEKKILKNLGARIRLIDVEPVPVSSTRIREALSLGLPTPELNPAVQEFCACKGLYGAPGQLERADLWLDRLFQTLNPHRFAHTLSVSWLAGRLAEKHGLSVVRARQAGLLHDCAKCYPLKEMQRIARENHLTEDPAFLSSGALLHSLVGAWVAEHLYGMEDREVLDAIAFHNTGHAGMSRLAMCVCLSDSIEPLREDYPLLSEIRQLSEVSLEKALLLSLESTADHVESRGKYLHPRTRDTIAWLKSLPECT